MSMNYAPIVLFVYKRLWHTQQTLDSLLKSKETRDSDLIVFCDGPKSRDDQHEIEQVRQFVRGIQGFRSVRVVEREHNLGLAASIISGVSEVLQTSESVIVVEDDLLLSEYFLLYMNRGLERYKREQKVACIHGYQYPVTLPVGESTFIRGADCWGWATWKDRWDCVEWDSLRLIAMMREKRLTKLFDFNCTYPYFNMLKNQALGKNNSWAIRWYAWAFLEEKLTLYPNQSLVQNIGFDGSGTHCKNGVLETGDGISNNPDISFPEAVAESAQTRRSIEAYFYKKMSWKRRFLRTIGLLSILRR